MIGNWKNYFLMFIGIIFLSNKNPEQAGTSTSQPGTGTKCMIAGMHTLSIHVRDTLTQDSVYQFLLQKLMLPVYYTPVTYSGKRYAGIYAGNMVLEPCGPYNNMNYAYDDFRAIFYGLNFEVNNSLEYFGPLLRNRGIRHQVNKGSIYIRDSLLTNENIFTSLYEVSDKAKRDSLRKMLITREKNNPGIEYIQEIMIGYKQEINIEKWKEYLLPLKIEKNELCQINDSLQIRFSKGRINEVNGIIFKVKSLQEAKKYFLNNRFLINESDKIIKLNPDQSYGLSFYFTDQKL